jgi:hypothetical protein
MSLTPKQWYALHQEVGDCYRNEFLTTYAADSGAFTYSDSGGSVPSLRMERLRVISAAHQPANMSGTPNALDANNMLKKMGRGSGLTTDTGKEGGGA